MTSASPLRVGLIGYGIAGAVFHAPLIAADDRLRLHTVVTASPERQEQVRAQHPDVRVCARAHEMFERAEELDLVVVAAPNRAHVELTSAALEAGLPVVVDKPFTPTAQQGRDLIDRARRAGLLLTVFQNRRWDNDARTVRSLLEAGSLGAVHRFESRFERWVPEPKSGWRDQGGPEDAAGVLYDLGSHLIDQALHLFGPVTSVYAESDTRRAGVRADDDTFVALTHRDGVRSHLWVSKLAAQRGPRFRVLGDAAAYTKYGLDPQEADLRAGHRPDGGEWGREPQSLWGSLGTTEDSTPVPTGDGRYQDFYAAVVDAVLSGGPPPVDPAEAVAGLEIIEAAQRSAAGGGVQHLT